MTLYRIPLCIALSARLFAATIDHVLIDGPGPRVPLTTRAGNLYDPRTIAADTRALFATGRFHDVTVTESSGTVTFHLVAAPQLLLREIHYEPAEQPVKLPAIDAAQATPATARRIAGALRQQLIDRGYPAPSVQPRIVQVAPGQADLILKVEPGKILRVDEVEFTGAMALPAGEIRSSLQALNTKRILPGWKLRPAFTHQALQSDLGRIGSLYIERGYFDSQIRSDGGTSRPRIRIEAGARSEVQGVALSGPGIAPRTLRYGDLCTCLLDLRRESEKLGYLDFRVTLAVNRAGAKALVTATIDRGAPYILRRLEFRGVRRFSDRAIRANMLLDEGEPLDSTLLRRSLARINRSGLFEPVDERGVEVRTNAAAGFADALIHLKERKFGSWVLSGPAGPMSVGGPLQFSLASRLPSWGRGILELSTYSVSASLLAQAGPLTKLMTGSPHVFLPLFAMRRPYSPGEGWKSGFLIAPQLGPRSMVTDYAMTQLRERLLPRLEGPAGFTAPITAVLPRDTGDAALLCEPRESKRWLRRAARVAF